MRKQINGLFVMALLALPAGVAGQASDQIQATANVAAQITVNGERALEFGDVPAGFSRTVAPDAAEAGRFGIQGTGELQVSLTFTLPPALADGGNTLPISFGPGSAGLGESDAAVDATFEPIGSVNANLVGGALWVFIGGTVDPDASQAPGNYSGTITLEVAYTGT